ncbi:MAG TPA: NUMOD3 domain-containing DNA-binding protein, partial [Clostridium sp.]
MKIICRYCKEIKEIERIHTNCLCTECYKKYKTLYDNYKMGIYKIGNIVNGKYYIGSATIIDDRWRRHIGTLMNDNHDNSYLQRAWNKYGKDNFIFSIIELVYDLKELTNTEQKYFNELIPFDDAIIYNMNENANGGGGNLGKKASDEARKNMSNAQKGRTHSEETKRVMSENQKGKSNSFYGKHFSIETLQKMSESRKG